MRPSSTPEGWLLVAPAAALPPLGPLIAAHRARPAAGPRRGPLTAAPRAGGRGGVRARGALRGGGAGRGLRGGAGGVLLVGDRRSTPRTALPGPFLEAGGGRRVPAGWLPFTGA